MTIAEAFQELINSPGYKETSKSRDSEGIKCRVYLYRFKKGTLRAGAMVELLLANDYSVDVNKVTKKSK